MDFALLIRRSRDTFSAGEGNKKPPISRGLSDRRQTRYNADASKRKGVYTHFFVKNTKNTKGGQNAATSAFGEFSSLP